LRRRWYIVIKTVEEVFWQRKAGDLCRKIPKEIVDFAKQ
jgi:hypothetical protein